MKTINFLLAIVFVANSLLLSSFSVLGTEVGSEEIQLVVKPLANSKKLLFGLANLNGKGAKLSIENSNNDVIYTNSWTNADQNAQIFNFSQLENGAYKLTVEVDGKVLSESFEVAGNSVKVINKVSQIAPRVNVLEDEKLIVSLSNSENERVVIRFYDDAGNLIYEESNNEGENLARIYNFKVAGKGSYSYTIQRGDNQYFNAFNIK